MPTAAMEPLLPSAPARPARTRAVRVGALVVGGAGVPVIAGPCSVEPDYVSHAAAMAGAGADALRGCVLKPRTTPGAFQGLGAPGLPLLDEARRTTGLPVISEPLQPSDVALLAPHCDALLVGARSMQCTPLLREVGRSGMPVVLKRGLCATYDEWLGAAEYILAEGNQDVILCERGIRTFEPATRNTLDPTSVAVLRDRCDLPVIVDPSHAAGRASWVPPLALAAVAAGADGLLVECHPDPAASWSDALQAIDPATLARLAAAVETLVPLVRAQGVSALEECREGIDAVDAALAHLLGRRAALVAAAQRLKGERGLPTRDAGREAEIVARVSARSRLGAEATAAVVAAVIEACLGTVGVAGAAAIG